MSRETFKEFLEQVQLGPEEVDGSRYRLDADDVADILQQFEAEIDQLHSDYRRKERERIALENCYYWW